MKQFTDTLKSSLETKGKELVEFREKYNIKIKADDSKENKEAPAKGDRQANILAH